MRAVFPKLGPIQESFWLILVMQQQFDISIIGIGPSGGVRGHLPMQIISVCGDGANAAMSVIKRLGMQSANFRS